MDTRFVRFRARRAPSPDPRRRALLAILTALLSPTVAWAQPVAGGDAVERSVYFVEKSTEATELLSQNKMQEALTAFQDLAARCPDLDEDGYVAMAIGDCLAGLGRDAEAQAAYRAAAVAHPELAASANQRITDLELAGEVSDALIERLRIAAAAPDRSGYTAAWQLGRALQKRAKALLVEAAAAFRTVSEADTPCPRSDPTLAHATSLQELADDLGSLIERLEDTWGSARRAMAVRLPDKGEAAAPVTEKRTAEWVLRTKDGRRIEFQMKWAGQAGDAQIHVLANGKLMKLDSHQRSALKRHEERINAILLQAMEEAGETARQGK